MEIPCIDLCALNQVENDDKIVLSPSKFTHLKNGCIAQESLQLKLRKSFPDFLLPAFSQKAIQGTVLHELMRIYLGRDAIDINDFQSTGEKIFHQEKERIFKNWPMILTTRIKLDYDSVFSLYSSLTLKPQTIPSYDGIKPHIFKEYTLDCSEELGLKGKLDFLCILGNKGIIKDYKSSQIYADNGEIKPEYIDQLSLYSLMVKSKFSEIDELSLYLEDFSGHSASVNSSDPDLLKKEVGEVRKKVFEALQSPYDYGNYSPGENCRYCNCKHICKYCKWTTPEPNEYFDFRGILKINEDRIDLFDNERQTALEILFDMPHNPLFGAIKEHPQKLIFCSNLKLILKTEDKWFGKCTDLSAFAIIKDE